MDSSRKAPTPEWSVDHQDGIDFVDKINTEALNQAQISSTFSLENEAHHSLLGGTDRASQTFRDNIAMLVETPTGSESADLVNKVMCDDLRSLETSALSFTPLYVSPPDLLKDSESLDEPFSGSCNKLGSIDPCRLRKLPSFLLQEDLRYISSKGVLTRMEPEMQRSFVTTYLKCVPSPSPCLGSRPHPHHRN